MTSPESQDVHEGTWALWAYTADEASAGAHLQYYTEGIALDGTWIKDAAHCTTTNHHVKMNYLDPNLKMNYYTEKFPSWIPASKIDPWQVFYKVTEAIKKAL